MFIYKYLNVEKTYYITIIKDKEKRNQIILTIILFHCTDETPGKASSTKIHPNDIRMHHYFMVSEM